MSFISVIVAIKQLYHFKRADGETKKTTMDIFTTKYPAKAHARRVAAAIKAKGQGDSGIIYLEGQKDSLKEDSDEHVHFR